MFKTEREIQDAAFQESLRIDKEKAELKELAEALAAIAAAKAKDEKEKKEAKEKKKTITMEELRALRCAFFET